MPANFSRYSLRSGNVRPQDCRHKARQMTHVRRSNYGACDPKCNGLLKTVRLPCDLTIADNSISCYGVSVMNHHIGN